MTRPRLLAAVLAATIAAGSTVAAACELFCAAECARASVTTDHSGCHEAPARSSPRGCPDRHLTRLAVLDGKAPSSIAAPAALLHLAPVLQRSLPELRSAPALVTSSTPFSASPPLILRV